MHVLSKKHLFIVFINSEAFAFDLLDNPKEMSIEHMIYDSRITYTCAIIDSTMY